jgi:tRNA threonylcarbamoyladenosine biosynthesis protein TsaB
MNILAIETSSLEATISLQHGAQQTQLSLGSQREQIRRILPTIEQLLNEQNVALADLQGLAFSAGPGSFTGLRVALGILQGLSLPFSIPVATVSSLQALAQKQHRLFNSARVVCARNAYMQQIYYGTYQLATVSPDQKIMMPIQPDCLLEPSQLPAIKPNETLAGDAWAVYTAEIFGTDHIKTNDFLITADAIDVLNLAIKLDDWQSIDQIQINYLRDKDAWQK